jgi:hypothetical protein
VSVDELDSDDRDDGGELPALAQRLRERAEQLCRLSLPEPERVLPLLAALEDRELANAVVANLQAPVADKARFAAEPRLLEKLRIALELTDGELLARGAAD